MDAEIRPVPFAPGYLASTDGHLFTTKWGTLRQLKPWVDRRGYLHVSLRVGGKTIKTLAHRAVAVTFLGPPPNERYEIRHLDGNPANNAVWNLAWGTHSENMRDVLRHGRHITQRYPERMARGERHGSKTKPERMPRGQRVGGSVLNEAQVREIRLQRARGEKLKTIARDFGISQMSVINVVRRKTWAHVA
jgi:hypothetical protein